MKRKKDPFSYPYLLFSFFRSSLSYGHHYLNLIFVALLSYKMLSAYTQFNYLWLEVFLQLFPSKLLHSTKRIDQTEFALKKVKKQNVRIS
jgi:hypothetical protein